MHALLKMYVKVPREQHFRFFSFSIVVFSILKSSMPTLQYNYYSPRDFFWIIFRVVVDQALVPYDSIVKAEVKVLITTTVMFCAELRHRRIQGKCFPFEVIRWHSTQCECGRGAKAMDRNAVKDNANINVFPVCWEHRPVQKGRSVYRTAGNKNKSGNRKKMALPRPARPGPARPDRSTDATGNTLSGRVTVYGQWARYPAPGVRLLSALLRD